MRLRTWVVTYRQRRILRSIGLVLLSLLAIGLYPPSLWAFVVVGTAWVMWRWAVRIRRRRRGETEQV